MRKLGSIGWAEINGIEVAVPRIRNYLRQVNYGATGSQNLTVALTAGDTVRIRSIRGPGTGANTTQAALHIERRT